MPSLVKEYLEWNHARERRRMNGFEDYEGIGHTNRETDSVNRIEIEGEVLSVTLVDLLRKCSLVT